LRLTVKKISVVVERNNTTSKGIVWTLASALSYLLI